MTRPTGRTLEDRIAAADDDWPADTADSESARYPWSYVGDDVPEDIHDRRFENVREGEMQAEAAKRERNRSQSR